MLINKVYLDRKSFQLIPDNVPLTEKNIYTIVVGSNGVGKSRLLKKIANAFRNINHGEYKKLNSHTRLVKVCSDGAEFDIYGTKHEFSSFCDIQYQSKISQSQVISVATTPFDKFPLNYTNKNIFRYSGGNSYHYIGLKVSKTMLNELNYNNILFRSFLINRSKYEGGEFFSLLNLKDDVKFDIKSKIYDLSLYLYRFKDESSVKYKHGEFVYIKELADSGLIVLKQKSGYNKEFIAGKIKTSEFESYSVKFEIEHGEKEGFIAAYIFLRNNYSGLFPALIKSPELLREVICSILDVYNCKSRVIDYKTVDKSAQSYKLLLDLGIINVSSVIFRDESGSGLQDKDLSSGQRCMILTILNIAGFIENNSVICIDEPEISLHPEWQREYVKTLMRFFSGYKNCHFIIATHSPLIISELNDDNCYFLNMSHRKAVSSKTLSYRSSDFQLVEAFGVPGNNNEYLNRVAVSLLSTVSKNAKFNNQDVVLLNKLKELGRTMNEGDNVKKLIRLLDMAFDELKNNE